MPSGPGQGDLEEGCSKPLTGFGSSAQWLGKPAEILAIREKVVEIPPHSFLNVLCEHLDCGESGAPGLWGEWSPWMVRGECSPWTMERVLPLDCGGSRAPPLVRTLSAAVRSLCHPEPSSGLWARLCGHFDAIAPQTTLSRHFRRVTDPSFN